MSPLGAAGAPPVGPSAPPSTVLAWLLTHKRKLLYGASAVVALYLARRAYVSAASDAADGKSPEPQGRLAKLLRTLSDVTQALGSLSSTSALVLTDLREFLASDQDELPRSLRQLNKLLQSQEIQSTLHASAATLLRAAQGSAAAASSSSSGDSQQQGPTALQQVIDAVLSDRGRTLVGMAVGLATKNATATFCEFLERMQQGSGVGGGAAAASWAGEGSAEQQQQREQQQLSAAGSGAPSALASAVQVLSSEQGERLISLLITKSIRTAVSTYMDATMGYNYYEDMVASIAKPVRARRRAGAWGGGRPRATLP